MDVPKLHRDEAIRQIDERKIDIVFALITVSTSRYTSRLSGAEIEDKSGDIAMDIIEGHGYKIGMRRLIPDDRDEIIKCLQSALESKCNVVIFIGGTGISSDDVTTDVLEDILEKRLYGFGELFRYLSYQSIGPSAMLSRAIAGTYKNAAIFALPGSPDAVRLALNKLIIPEIKHIVYLLEREN